MKISKRPDGMIRVAFLFMIFYSGFGLAMPYISLWFESKNLTSKDIGFAWSAFMIARTIGAFLWSFWADRLLNLKKPLFYSAVGSIIIYCLLMVDVSSMFIIILWGVCGLFYPVKVPLIDSLASQISQKQTSWSFGVIRSLGSVTFLIANILGGLIISRFNIAVILPVMMMIVILTLFNIFMIPDQCYVLEKHDHKQKHHLKQMLSYILKSETFLFMIVISVLLQSAHGFYYSMSSIAWSHQNLTSMMIGILWGVGVSAEIVFFFFSDFIIKKLGILRLIILSGIASIIRWTGLAYVTDPVLLIPLQILHAFTFSASYIVFIHYVRQYIPKYYQTTAFGLNIALSNGLALSLSTAFSGVLYTHYGRLGYLLMSFIGGVSLIFSGYLLNKRGLNQPLT